MFLQYYKKQKHTHAITNCRRYKYVCGESDPTSTRVNGIYMVVAADIAACGIITKDGLYIC